MPPFFIRYNVIHVYSPAKTLGILDMKLLTVRTGTPVWSSCICSTIDSIWKRNNHKILTNNKFQLQDTIQIDLNNIVNVLLNYVYSWNVMDQLYIY